LHQASGAINRPITPLKSGACALAASNIHTPTMIDLQNCIMLNCGKGGRVS
jgi:hypothetical protein